VPGWDGSGTLAALREDDLLGTGSAGDIRKPFDKLDAPAASLREAAIRLPWP